MSNKKIHRFVTGAIAQASSNNRDEFKATKSPYCRHYMRIMFPYCIDESGLVLNREYKPLGVGGYGDYVDYRDYPESYLAGDAIQQSIRMLPKRGYVEEGFFYNDGNHPWDSAKNFNAYIKLLNKWLEIIE